MYLTRKLKLGRTDQLDRLAWRAGDLWSTVAKWHWRFVRRQGYWLSKGQAQKIYCKGYDGLHSQSAQAVADSFYDALQAWRRKQESGQYEGLRPPYRQKRYFKVQMNQRLHQWAYSKFEHMLTYKAQLCGTTVERTSEACTTQTCPNCGHRHKLGGRDFDCPQCWFSGHRDAVGARNILNERYSGEVSTDTTQIAGEMASPTGIRYEPNMRCNPASLRKTCFGRQECRPVG
jgi:predicted RNA-binding Zn-ribbon protein involved in translation (DUF1610 family)